MMTLDEVCDKIYPILDEIPRFRGWTWMYEAEPENEQEYKDESEVEMLEHLIESGWKIDASSFSINDETRALKARLITDEYKIRYELLTEFQKTKLDTFRNIRHAQIENQIRTFNSFVGNRDIIAIRARIGGNNWKYYEGETKIATQPWFIKKIDDYFDETYCDIYARIPK